MLFEMKKLKNLRLKGGVKVFTTSDMKMLKGGSVMCKCSDDGPLHSSFDCDDCFKNCPIGSAAICVG